MRELASSTIREEIAIIGMAAHFPGAKSIDELWRNLCEGIESIETFSVEELKASGVDEATLQNPSFVNKGAVMEGADRFDASFFGLSPLEAEIMDPQHRVFLECAWEALENAGYDPETFNGRIGVFGGVAHNSYFQNILATRPDVIERAGHQLTVLANDKDYAVTRVSFKLNLKGPSISVNTACSSSGVALHIACQSVLSGECDMALVGGARIQAPLRAGYLYQEGGILSPDGQCRAFDAEARGTRFGSGVAMIAVKRLSDALRDGDSIHAVVKGTAINNDGYLKVGFTAPSIQGQAAVIEEALAMAEVAPDSIGYVETHGTGTSLGDPIEVAALTKAYRKWTERKRYCPIGSVKTNIGHLDAAAGVAGIIKTVLALEHKQIPPSLNFNKPNPQIDFENSPFYVNTKLSQWSAGDTPRRAGVSSFGLGGTNAHIILEEAPEIAPSGTTRPQQLLLISAKSERALNTSTANIVEHLKQHSDLNLADVAYTLQIGRKAFDYRRMIVCQSLDDCVTALETTDPERVLTYFQEPMNREIVFMFSGQGSQYVNMGLELYRNETQFREQIDRCSEILQPHLSLDLRDVLYPADESVEEVAQKLKQTLITQPALFAIEYALAKLWMSWGVNPTVMVGHSIGEYVAACLARVFSLEDALSLVAARGRLMQELAGGSMLAVPLSEKEIEPFLNEDLSLSAVNGPSFCTVSGHREVIEDLERRLSKKNVDCRHLHTSHAFHSKMMDPILDEFIEQAKKTKCRTPQIPIVSTVSGTWIKSDEAMGPSYWAKNLRQTVRFSDCVNELLKEPRRVFLEVGPGQTLSTLVRQHPNSSGKIVLSSIRHPQEHKSDIAFILNTLGRLWLAGIQVDWSGFYKDEKRHRVPLPTYPFERQRYWVEGQQPTQIVPAQQKVFHKKADIAKWFYVPSWKRSVRPTSIDRKAFGDQKLCWMIFLDRRGLGSKLAKHLDRQGQDVITVQVGEVFGSVGHKSYTIDPQARDDYETLIRDLQILGRIPQKIVHLWSFTPNEDQPSKIEFFNRIQDLGFFSLIFLTQALAKHHVSQTIELEVVTNHLHEVTDEQGLLCAEKATVLGPCKVVPQEYPNITCRNIDLDLAQLEEKQIEQLLGDLAVKPNHSAVAYRGKHRWVQIFEPLELKDSIEAIARVREGGVYLITGGLGGVGLALGEHLARTLKAKLILIGRSGLPPRELWQQWLMRQHEAESLSRKIRNVMAIEDLGSEVLIVKADVANEDEMRRAIAKAEERFGGINGVIHSAGIVARASIDEITRGFCEQQFQSKVSGLFVLEKVLEGKDIDFCLLTSSLSSALGGIGYAAYAAANLFMDAFAHRHNQTHSVPWISVNWDAWEIQEEIAQSTGTGTELTELAIKPREGGEALLRILSSDLGHQILVSTGDLEARLNKWIKLESLRETEQTGKAEISPLHSRPTLSSVYVVPGNQTEQSIAEIWQKLLRIEKVGIHDNFFELGGHSLLASQVIARLRNKFPIDFSVSTLFERPTVHSLSKMILDEQKGGPSFAESQQRGHKRKERKLRRMRSERGIQFHEEFRSN